MLSVIIPTDRHSECSILDKTLKSLNGMENVEVICIDKKEAGSRAERLNIGVRLAKGEIILFNHPRSFVDPEGIKSLIQMSLDKNRVLVWGGFIHHFDKEHFLLKFTSWYSNNIRGALRGILYLDHCIFFDRKLWKSDLPNVDIFEDTLLSYDFRRLQRPLMLPFTSTTSSVRFQVNGIWKQAFLNQALKIAFHLNAPHFVLNRFYERGLDLNSTYPKRRK